MHLKVEKGKTYYLRFDLKMGFWNTTAELTLVDSISAFPKIHNGKMQELPPSNRTFKITKNRLGMNLNMGAGFQNTSLITATNGIKSTISFGGGSALGLKYGHEFSKHFDLAFDLNYQENELTPRLSNAKITFGRGIISITPSYILPIMDGETMRMKFGAGLDRYFGSVLSIDMSKIPGGFKDKWNYNSSLGYHLSAIYEMNLNQFWSLDCGLKYYSVSYKFMEGLNAFPTDSKLITPKGSGIDLLLGIYYHF